MNDELNREIEKTINSLDSATSLKANPYFYSRLKLRMENEAKVTLSWRWSLATTLLLVILNTAFVLRFWPEENRQTEAIETLASEYSNMWPSIYDNELIYENE